jgi:hypothetical protein
VCWAGGPRACPLQHPRRVPGLLSLAPPAPAAGGTAAGLSAAALASSFLGFDAWWREARCDPGVTETGWDESGSTALVGLLAGDTLTVGNAGDGAALLARGGRAARLSEEVRGRAGLCLGAAGGRACDGADCLLVPAAVCLPWAMHPAGCVPDSQRPNPLPLSLPQHRAAVNAAEVQRILTAGGRFVVTQPGGSPRVVGTTGAARYKASMVTR